MLSRRLFLRRAAVAPLLASPAITALASLAPVEGVSYGINHEAMGLTTVLTKPLSSCEAACYRAINAYIEHETKKIMRKRVILANPNFKPYHHAYKELTP